MLRKIIESDAAVKLIFDHFKNIAVASLVMSAAIWVLKNPATGFLAYFSYASAVALCLLGVTLFVINERHGNRKIKEANLPTAWHFVYIFVYGFSFIHIFVSLIHS